MRDKITTQRYVINRLKACHSQNIWYFSSLSLQRKHTQIKTCENIFLFLVSYGCETRSPTLAEEHRFWGAQEQGAEENISASEGEFNRTLQEMSQRRMP
jgi:hypothetical protein